MKRVIKSAKFFSPYLNEDEQQDRLKIPAASVRDCVLDSVNLVQIHKKSWFNRYLQQFYLFFNYWDIKRKKCI